MTPGVLPPQAELDFLVAELARAVGLGGRDRRRLPCRAGSTECDQIDPGGDGQPGSRQPSLGRHLAATIRTGRYCSYTPDPHAPITWDR